METQYNSKSTVKVLLKHDMICFKFGNVDSFDAVKTGIVSRIWNDLKTLGYIFLLQTVITWTVKRLMKEALELSEPTDEYSAHPLEDNLFEWHFTMRGPQSSEFEGGIYHGRILLPTQYPMKPPNIILLTPNGRWEINKKICLSISSHHPETWQPSWSIRTALLALIAYMPTKGRGSLGALEYTPEERLNLAKKSHNWVCDKCGLISNLLTKNKAQPLTEEESELINSVTFKGEDTEKMSKSSEQEIQELEVINDEPAINNLSTNFFKDILCSDMGMYLIYLIIALISILVARRFCND